MFIDFLTKVSVVALVSISGVLLTAVPNQAAAQANNRLPISVCEFPDDRALLSYSEGDAVYPNVSDDPLQLSTAIPAGTYTVVAESYEDHTNTNHPTQLDERWQLIGYNGSQEVYRSGFTDDIPDNEDTTTTIIGQSVDLPEITAIRYAHIAYTTGLESDQFGGAPFDSLTDQQKALVEWHSVEPSCIEFTPEEDPGQVSGTVSSCEDLTVSQTAAEAVVAVSATLAGVPDTASLDATFTATNNLDSSSVEASSNSTMAELALEPGTYTIDAVIRVDNQYELACQTEYTVAEVATGEVLGATTDPENQGGGNEVLAETGTAHVAVIVGTGLILLTVAVISYFGSSRLTYR